MSKYRSEMNLTEGNLFIKIIKFSLPLMATTVFQLLYTTVDLWTVSNFGGGSLSMTSIGSNNAVINLIVIVLVALSTSSNVCISIAKGSNDKDKAEKILHTAFVIAVIGGILVGIFGYFMAPTFLRWMNTPDALIDNATRYLQIYFLGAPLMCIYNFGTQMLRALGDSKRPFYILMISGVINILVDLLFVIVFDMDVAGVALATVISQFFAALFVVLYFRFNKTSYVKLDFNKLKVNREELREILKIGIPGALQGLAFCFPNLMIQSSLYSITNPIINGVSISVEELVAGSSASAQIEGYMFAFLDSLGVSLISFTGQNYGALKKENMRKCYWFSVIWMFIFWIILTIISLGFADQLFSIFIQDEEDIIKSHAIIAGKERMTLLMLTYALDGWMDLNGSYLRGMKEPTAPMIITLSFCCGTRIIFLLTLFKMEFFHTLFWLYFVFPISWVLADLTYIPTILNREKKRFKMIDNKLLKMVRS